MIRESEVWSAVTYPLQTRLEAADDIRNPAGEVVKAVFMGGHTHVITQAIADEITAANLGATIT